MVHAGRKVDLPILVSGLLVLSASTTLYAGNPWEDLMGPGTPQIWNDPQSRFYIDLPVGWQPLPNNPPTAVRFGRHYPDYGHSALATVEMRSVPPGVNTRHFATRIEAEIERAAPGYRVLTEDSVRVSGQKGLRRHFLYRDKNNAQRYREVVQVITVLPERAFIITLETAYGTRSLFWEEFEKMVRGFRGRSPGEDSLPMPKPRRRVKSGEMIDPDAVRY